MKNRNWSKTSLRFVFVAVALALLISIANAHDKRTESSLKVQQGQEIVLSDNLKIVVGRVENGQAEISIYRNSEAAQPIQPQQRNPDKPEKPEKPEKPNPCPCSCPEKKPKEPREYPLQRRG